MKKRLFFVIFALFFASCGIDAPEPNEYEAFRCIEEPEARVYYPEETMIFKFNMPVNPNSLNGFSVSSENTGKLDSAEVSGNQIRIMPPLPAEDNIFVTLTSALKSIDNKPLMTGEQFTENKDIRELVYETGKKLPEVAEIIPDDSKSRSVAVRFDSEVEIKVRDVDPRPEDMVVKKLRSFTSLSVSFLFRYRKLTVILVPVGKVEGDDVIACAGEINLHAIRCKHQVIVYQYTRSRSDLHGNLAEVFGESDQKHIPVDHSNN